MLAEPKPHVFLSHVREDAERVERLAVALEARGIGTWIDRHRIKPGERWQKAIEDAIRSGAFFVACFSQASAARSRSYMNEELMLAIEEVRLRPDQTAWFIPVRLDDCLIPDRRIGPGLSIRSFQWLDMFPDWAESVGRLAEAIRPSSPSRAAVFIDGDWLLDAARAARIRIDFKRLLVRLQESFGDDVPVALELTGRGARERALADELRRLGYSVGTPAVKARRNVSNVDMTLAIRAFQSASDTLVLISGDNDLVTLIEHARQQGRATIVLAFSSHAAAALRQAADRCIDLEEFMLGHMPS